MIQYECLTLDCKNQVGVKGSDVRITCKKCGGRMYEQMRTTKKAKKQRNKHFPYRKSSGKDKRSERALKSKFKGEDKRR